jgi:hypothetical protein
MPLCGVVEHEARALAEQLFLAEELGDAQRVKWPAGRVRLKGGHAQLVRDVQQAFNICPGNRANKTGMLLAR